MTPVDQTTFAGTPAGGNCMQATVASILDLPLDEVTNFIAEKYFWGSFHKFFEDRGMYAQCRAPNTWPRGKPYIGIGWSGRGVLHAVVMQDGELVHDPHPSRAGLVELKEIYVLENE